MKKKYLYKYIKTRKQRSKLFIRMGLGSLFYIVILHLVKSFSEINITSSTYNIIVGVLTLSALVLFYIAWWHIKNPANYSATITSKELSISYEEVPTLSFCINIADIERIENRNVSSGGGQLMVNTGVLMSNGDFHVISMNYGNNIDNMFKVLKSINPSITFSKSVKTDFYLFNKKIK